MSLYVISCLDHPGSLELRQRTRPAHLAYLEGAEGVKVGGPYLDAGSGQMIGSMMVIETNSLEAAQEFAAADPYAKAGLFASSTVMPWRQTVGNVAVDAD